MITIVPQYLTLSKLLDGRLFHIPEYQRAYSWTSNERQDLFGDIEKVRAKGQDAGLCFLFIHPRAPNLINLRSAGTMPA